MKIDIVDDNGIRVSRNIGAHSLWEQVREAMDAGARVSVEFDARAEVEHLAAGDDDGWVSPADVDKAVDRLQDEWVMANNSMSNAETGEAAREWATRMRCCEKAILTLKQLVSS